MIEKPSENDINPRKLYVALAALDIIQRQTLDINIRKTAQDALKKIREME